MTEARLECILLDSIHMENRLNGSGQKSEYRLPLGPIWTRKGQEVSLCDAENVLYLVISGGSTGTYIKLHSLYIRTLKFSVLYVPAVCMLYLKKKKCLFPCLATTLIKPGGLLVPCCSDQEITSLDDINVYMSLLLSHCLSSLLCPFLQGP